MIRALLLSMRPQQWTKNLFVFVAPLFAKSIHEPVTARLAGLAFAAFCLAASAVYLLNDVADREEDRRHPEKRRRPIASGALPVPTALFFAAAFLAGGLALAWWVNLPLLGLVALYVAIQVGYSLSLRHIVLVDVFCIASGFVIRVMAGAVAVDVECSSWLILTTIFLSLFLALAKRRAESVRLGGEVENHRKTLEEYAPEFLDELIAVTTASVVICYSLYTLDERTIREFGTRNLVFTVPFVVFGIFRYLFLMHRREGGGSPVATIARDLPLALTALGWAVVTGLILYL